MLFALSEADRSFLIVLYLLESRVIVNDGYRAIVPDIPEIVQGVILGVKDIDLCRSVVMVVNLIFVCDKLFVFIGIACNIGYCNRSFNS